MQRPKIVGEIARVWLLIGVVCFGFSALMILALVSSGQKNFSDFGGLACILFVSVLALTMAAGFFHLEEWAYDFTDFLFSYSVWIKREKLHDPEVRAAFGKLPEDD